MAIASQRRRYAANAQRWYAFETLISGSHASQGIEIVLCDDYDDGNLEIGYSTRLNCIWCFRNTLKNSELFDSIMMIGV